MECKISEDDVRFKKCPFCGTLGETYLQAVYLNRKPTMSGKGNNTIISVELKHWCNITLPRQPSQRPITRVGRDIDSVVLLWNMRNE